MIRINNHGLFRDFTAQEAAEMKKWATDIVLHGKTTYPDPVGYLPSWMQVHNYDERQRLFTLSVALLLRRRAAVPGHVFSNRQGVDDDSWLRNQSEGAGFLALGGFRRPWITMVNDPDDPKPSSTKTPSGLKKWC